MQNRDWDTPLAWLIALTAIGLTVFQSWGEWATDFSALYFAAEFWASGQWSEIYAAPPLVIAAEMPESWATAVAAAGYPDEQTYPFIYPPWVAAAVYPLTWLDPVTAMHLVLIVNALLLMTSAFLAWRIMGRPMSATGWMTASAILVVAGLPAQSAAVLGQMQILVVTLTLFAFERYKAGKTVAAGTVLALAAAIKLTPAAFVLIFLLDRNRRAFWVFAGAGAAMAGLSVLLMGWPLHAIFLARLGVISDNLYIAYISWSVEPFLFQISDWLSGTAPLHVELEYHYPKPAWISYASKILALFALAALWLCTRATASELRWQTQLFGLALIVPLFGPLGWAHYYLTALFLFPGLFALLPRQMALLLFTATAGALSVPVQLALMETPQMFFPQILIAVSIFAAVLCAIVLTSRTAGIISAGHLHSDQREPTLRPTGPGL